MCSVLCKATCLGWIKEGCGPIASIDHQCFCKNFVHPVSYFSRKFTKHQVKYLTIEKETLALLLALQHFEVYLGSSAKPIQVFTDHNPLVFLSRMQNHNQRLMRWSLIVQGCKLDICHKKGCENVLADACHVLFSSVEWNGSKPYVWTYVCVCVCVCVCLCLCLCLCVPVSLPLPSVPFRYLQPKCISPVQAGSAAHWLSTTPAGLWWQEENWLQPEEKEAGSVWRAASIQTALGGRREINGNHQHHTQTANLATCTQTRLVQKAGGGPHQGETGPAAGRLHVHVQEAPGRPARCLQGAFYHMKLEKLLFLLIPSKA